MVDDNWVREPMRIPVFHSYHGAPRIVENNVVDHVETASIASIYSRETSRRDAIGFAVDSVYAFFLEKLIMMVGRTTELMSIWLFLVMT